MTVLFSTHPRYLEHDPGRSHPERPARLEAVAKGAAAAAVGEALAQVAPRPATRAELELVHHPAYVDAVEQFCAAGGGHLDADTAVAPQSFDAALLAAGAGPDAVERLERGEGSAAFCAVRPPGHHALPTRAMGFCLFNNVAVTAATLADRGERVVVVDIDAHHGNGTQDVFYEDPRVLYVSMHEYPLYPGTGWLDEIGAGPGRGATINLPFPARATGDVYLAAMDEVLAPAVSRFGPTWLLVSAGFDAHRRDPITGLALSAGDYADLTVRLLEFAPAGRRILFLEGGYDLQALADSAGACLAALVGVEHRPEAATGGGPGREVVGAALKVQQRLGD